jgi:hypothetical protein
MNTEQEQLEELNVICATAQKHATAVDSTHYTVARDTYGALMSIAKDLKGQGWRSGWICGENGSTQKRITVFPPGQEPEPRGVFFRPGEGARRYIIYVDKEQP